MTDFRTDPLRTLPDPSPADVLEAHARALIALEESAARGVPAGYQLEIVGETIRILDRANGRTGTLSITWSDTQ